MKEKIKNDKYRRTRGGYSRLLSISCVKCGSQVCLYQKDGPGVIKRMYLDRIMEPKASITAKELSCAKGHQIGIRMIYEKEDRLAYRVFVDAISKKIIKKQ